LAKEVEGADQLALLQHWNAEHGPETSYFEANSVRRTDAIGRFCLHVRYLNRLLGRGHSCECGSGGEGEHRIAPPCFDECRRAMHRNRAERIALE
jgi:hypothetical protein